MCAMLACLHSMPVEKLWWQLTWNSVAWHVTYGVPKGSPRRMITCEWADEGYPEVKLVSPENVLGATFGVCNLAWALLLSSLHLAIVITVSVARVTHGKGCRKVHAQQPCTQKLAGGVAYEKQHFTERALGTHLAPSVHHKWYWVCPLGRLMKAASQWWYY